MQSAHRRQPVGPEAVTNHRECDFFSQQEGRLSSGLGPGPWLNLAAAPTESFPFHPQMELFNEIENP